MQGKWRAYETLLKKCLLYSRLSCPFSVVVNVCLALAIQQEEYIPTDHISFGAMKSVDRRFWTTYTFFISGCWGSKSVKCSVRSVFAFVGQVKKNDNHTKM